jgi:glycosyltransferase involved in cell wall biosynthesis
VFKPTESDFRKRYGLEDKFVILGIAFDWGIRKGLDVFLKLAGMLGDEFAIVLVGTTDEIDKQLPDNIISIQRTSNQKELAEIYTACDVFVNPTREENFPTVNIEALACGTPVITFNTGGSVEIPDETCGAVVECEDVNGLFDKIHEFKTKPKSEEKCLLRAQMFDKDLNYEKYIALYKEI